VGEIIHDERTGHDLTVNINHANGTAFNVWQAEPEILDGPGEFPFGHGGYYAVYFRGPDRLKLEVVHMPLAEQRARARGLLRSR
jgi:hypothetical protein